ncbi:MAG: RNA polymerase sigma factor [Bryobacteraceae bacterium]
MLPARERRESEAADDYSPSSIQSQVERLFLDSREDVYYYLLTLGLSPGVAQETTQEVFLRLYSALRQGQEIENLRGWVFRVAHNLGLNTKSREKVWSPYDSELQFTAASKDSTPEERILQAERVRRVREAMAELSPKQRQVLHLRAEGMRYREIAETLGLSGSTVNEFLRRAMRKLRKVVYG